MSVLITLRVMIMPHHHAERDEYTTEAYALGAKVSNACLSRSTSRSSKS
jgi:hypothetical protein